MMNTRKQLLAILLSVFMLVSVMPLSFAVTVAAEEGNADNRVVYVSTDGSDSTGNGTAGNPYATLSKAMTVIETDDTATAGTIIISEDNDGAGIAFTSAAHTKMITIEGITSSILIDASDSGTWRQTQGPLTFDNISVKRLGLEPRGHELVIKEGVILEGVGNDRLNVRAGYNTSNGDTVYMGAYQHDTNTKDVYMYIGSRTVTGDLNIYINDIYAKSVDIRDATYNGNVNLTVNNYRKSTNGGDDLWIGTGATISGALQVILNNGVRNIHKDYFRDRGPSGRTWLLYGETAVDGTILEMSDTVGVYNVKGDMTANAYKVTATSNDFSDTLSETAIVSNDGVLDLRESGAGEYFIRYTYNRTVYVSTDGSDSTGDGTAENPYATLSKAMTVIEDDTAAVAGTIIISGDNAGEGIAFTAAAHTKMITVEGITPSIVIVGNGNTKYKNIFGPLTIDNVTFKNLGLNPYGYKLVLKDGVTFASGITNIHTGKTETGTSAGTVSGVDIYIDAEEHSTYQDDLYLTVGRDNAYTVNGDVNVYINNMFSQGLDIETGTYNGNVNLTVNNYQKNNINGGDDIYLRNSGTVTISGALQVVLNNGVTTGKYKANFRDGGPSGRTWLLYGETAADGTILEMSDTVGVYNVKGGMTANAYKVTTSTSNFANDTVSETAVTSNNGVLDLREAGAGEYYIQYTPVAFKTHSLVLTDAIGVNFHMGLGGLTEEEKAASYMTFAIDNQAEEQRMDFVDTFTSGENYGFTCFISSVQMAENITPTFHFGNGETVTGSAFSAKDYIDYVVANSGSFPSNVVTLVKTLGDYGHYAQIYLGFKNDWVAGTDYIAIGRYRAADYTDYDAYTTALSGDGVTKTIEGTAVTGLGYSLNFDSKTYVNVELRTTDSLIASATVGDMTLFLSSSGKLRTQALPILKLGEPIVITGRGTSNTNAFTITLSGLSYIRAILNSDSFSDKAKNTVAALYDYYQAARTYKGLS